MIRTQSRQVGRWPDQPRRAPREAGCAAPGPAHAFPSGRAAILACLELAGIGPDSVVATPECVTECVAQTVRRRARPVSLRQALASGARAPAAAIVYEQWGWPLPPAAVAALGTRLTGVPVVLDRVDSADFFAHPRSYGAFEVLSLSKVLGLDAGGLGRAHGAYLEVRPGRGARRAPSADRPALRSHPAVRELFKQSDATHPSVTSWLADNCAHTALEAERRERSAAARWVMDSELGAGWPAWMRQAIECGAGPVWAPVLRGSDAAVQWRGIGLLARAWGVTAAVRMFNWTGDPLSPDYAPSVALPIHGGVPDLAQIISALAPTARAR